tara:strand:+ start:11056 stop:11625 length:570 start_codon:yes stop_codon:yes gene_type:complete
MTAKKVCKFCGTYGYDHIRVHNTSYCNYDCVAKYGILKAAKDREKTRKRLIKDDNKKHAKKKREFYANDIKTRRNAAKAACHLYIRTRDKNDGCICCGRPLGKNYDAGHWLESGNNSFLRYHEDNIHAQSVYCNQYKGGDSDDYEGRLRLKIGNDRVDWLKANKGGTVKRTAQDYKDIELYFKQKLTAP